MSLEANTGCDRGQSRARSSPPCVPAPGLSAHRGDSHRLMSGKGWRASRAEGTAQVPIPCMIEWLHRGAGGGLPALWSSQQHFPLTPL